MKKVIGNTSVTFGDRHIENVYRGQHVNYQANCYWCMDKTVEKVWELEPALYNETGDFIGVRNGVSWLAGDRIMLSKTMRFLESLRCPVVINRGNHDMHGSEDRNDYIFLSSMGYFSNPTQLAENGKSIGRMMLESPDFKDPETGEPLRIVFHYVPYGKESEKLDLVEGATNVAVTHYDFRIGAKNFTQDPEAIDLVNHAPFFGVDLVLNGHIHNPSEPTVYTDASGHSGLFINLGCMARPSIAEDYDFVWCGVVGFRKNELTGQGEVYFDPQVFKLRPASEVFVEQEGAGEDAVAGSVKSESKQLAFTHTFESLKNFNWAGVSMAKRIDLVPMEEDVKSMLLDYLKIES